MKKLINKTAGFIFNLIGLPYYIAKEIFKWTVIGVNKLLEFIKNVVNILIDGIKKFFNLLTKFIKTLVNSFTKIAKFTWKWFKKIIIYIPKLIKYVANWILKAIKESIAQIFTLLGFFIAWLTLTGSAKDTVGIAIIVSTALWLLTIGLREE
jgi:hypothetical protein